MKKKVLVLPGDGIGSEVCDAALMVLEQFQLPIELTYGDIGWECWKQGGDPVPQATWQKINECDAVLLGAVTSKGKKAALKELALHLQERQFTYVSPVIQLRQKLGLFLLMCALSDTLLVRESLFIFVLSGKIAKVYTQG
ncbi:hypothetical protein MCW_01631 [Cardidatus Bartonella washoeensis 085-0475]|uniref:Isopropylmalate dehydrogenase-like domain-containing protein n=1 Tax=Cardidatus Bartonella washoeensis 085-0475 TaxID=1094564 RepID=J0QI56_9HYPH|nr:hypothetical protein MCW_01631 [Bartonella washoeensis 085-0475]